MKTGILLINTGTPEECSEEAIAAYLGEFLMDPAIIGAPAFIRRRIVANACKKRPAQTLPSYREFWTEEGSPFIIASRKQQSRLGIELSGRLAGQSQVALAMRYGTPSIEAGLAELREGGCRRVVLVPLYPQFVRVCAGTCLKEARRCLDLMAADGWEPQVLEVKQFFDHPSYVHAVATKVAKNWDYQPGAKLVVSFHSTMMSDIKDGDPYKEQTEQTCEALRQVIGLKKEDVILCYSSRFDKRKWLGPFTSREVERLARQGVKNICVVCPGFVAENIETAIEVDRSLREAFLKAAGEGASFNYAPALNADAGLILAVADSVMAAIEEADEAQA